ncbi:superoxide dismutase [Candidatus Phytoplasma oryzae]|nr:superoxide dismutase [Candidatus Phytoplasma oryzae]
MKKYSLPELGYEYNNLEPFIDRETMELHYTKHHQNYLNNLNNSLSQYPNLNTDLITLLKKPFLIPEDIRLSVQNNGGGFLNHSFFWKILKKRNQNEYDQLSTKLKELIMNNFQNLENFKDLFAVQAQKLFGSGWIWLILNLKNELQIVSTINQETVVNIGRPIIGLDVWEHAYYLFYKNNRASYIESFFNIINWEQASENLNENFFEKFLNKK